jgi:hypothetical protein
MARIPLLLALGALAWPATAAADTLRCGGALVRAGDSIGYVLEKCGEPQYRSLPGQPTLGRTAQGGTYVAGFAAWERWRYDRGSGRFAANLTFVEGKLRRIDFERARS